MIYYVNNSGSDSNPGTQAQPFQTIAKVNALALVAGDSVLFEGGQIFEGSLTLSRSGAASNRITFNSSGTGKAIISGGDLHGVRIQNASYVRVANLIFQGSGVDTVTGASTSGGTGGAQSPSNNRVGVGIDLVSDTSGATANTITPTTTGTPIKPYSGVKSYTDFVFDSCEVRGFYQGAYVRAEPATAGQNADGLDKVSFLNCSIHDCLHFGIYTLGGNSNRKMDGAFQFYDDRVITNLIITGTEIYNVPGDPNNVVATGVMMQLNNVLVGLVEGCEVHHGVQLTGKNGNLAGGGGGIIPLRADYVTVRGCKAHDLTTVMSYDSCGFDADIDTHFCVFERNLSYNNYGAGFQSGGGGSYNVFRYNVSINDGRNPAGQQKSLFSFGFSKTLWHNNTVYLDRVPYVLDDLQPCCVNFVDPQTHYLNNIFVTRGNAFFLRAGNPNGAGGSIANNQYWNLTGTPRWKVGSDIYTSLESFRARGVGYETLPDGTATGRYENPQFKSQVGASVAPGDYVLRVASNAKVGSLSPYDTSKFPLTAPSGGGWPLEGEALDYAGAVASQNGALGAFGAPVQMGALLAVSTPLAVDSYTGTAGALLQNHVPETGTLTKVGGSDAVISGTGTMRSGAVASSFHKYAGNPNRFELDFVAADELPNQRYAIAYLRALGNAGGPVSGYVLQYLTDRGFFVSCETGGAYADISPETIVKMAPGSRKRLVATLEDLPSGTRLLVSADGVIINDYTDTAPFLSGDVWLQFYGDSSETMGLAFDNLLASSVVMAEQPVPDTISPSLTSASIDVAGTSLTLTFSESVTGVFAAQFALSGATLSNVAGSGENRTMAISPSVYAGAAPTLSYSGTGTVDISAQNNPMQAFSGVLVDNGSTAIAPVVFSQIDRANIVALQSDISELKSSVNALIAWAPTVPSAIEIVDELLGRVLQNGKTVGDYFRAAMQGIFFKRRYNKATTPQQIETINPLNNSIAGIETLNTDETGAVAAFNGYLED